MAVTDIITTMMTRDTIMTDELHHLPALALLRQQSWLSAGFPTGAYSYSHGIEWAVEVGHINDRESLVDWLEADLCYGSGRNEAIFFNEAWRCVAEDDRQKLFEVAEPPPAFPAPPDFSPYSSHPTATSLL